MMVARAGDQGTGELVFNKSRVCFVRWGKEFWRRRVVMFA